MIKPGEEFSPEKIVNLALRQNIGVDNSSSVKSKHLRKKDSITYEQKLK